MADYRNPLNIHFKEELKNDIKKAPKIWPFLTIAVFIILGFVLMPSKTILTSKKGWNTSKLILVNKDFQYLFEEAKKGKDINILILGISGGDHISPNLTDSIMIFQFNPYRAKSALVSIPRDLYVRAPDQNNFVKINSLQQNYGINSLMEKIKEIAGIEINLYTIIDLDGLENLVDNVGGLYLPYPYQNQNKLAYFSGRDVLKYVRLRPDSDFGRIKRQQIVIETLKDKLLALNPFFDIYKIYQTISIIKSHLSTNLSFTELKTLFMAFKNNNIKTEYLTIDTSNFLEAKMITTDIGNQYVLTPIEGTENYSDIQSYINEKL